MLLPTAALVSAANLFAASYNQSMEVYRQDPTNVKVFSETLSTYFNGSAFAGFFGGHVSAAGNTSNVAAGLALSINFLNKEGYGHDLVMDQYTVEPYSDAGALVRVTWRIRPRNGQPSWIWRTLYGYRWYQGTAAPSDALIQEQAEGGAKGTGWEPGQPRPTGYWEYTNTDDEIKTCLLRMPDYLDSYQP
jgi:hypothetical protein